MLRQLAKGAAIVGGVVAVAAVAPIALGFGTGGIVAGSIAAGIQAGIGNVAAGSLFASMTSLGMTGFFTSTATAGAIVGTGGLAAYLGLNNNENWRNYNKLLFRFFGYKPFNQ